MRSISIAQAKAFDRQAQEKYGVSSIVLMENAGRSVAEEALKMLRGRKRVAVVCGVGNNGGDGFVATRHLLNRGIKVKVYLLGSKAKLKSDPRTNLNILRKIGLKAISAKSVRDLSGIKSADLIIDAIFGIGLNSQVREPYLSVIQFLNQTKIPILAVDVSSGLDADTGKPWGAAVKANQTVTFVASKIGFSKADGPRYCGKIVVRDIY